jgi:hypothetical protein
MPYPLEILPSSIFPTLIHPYTHHEHKGLQGDENFAGFLCDGRIRYKNTTQGPDQYILAISIVQ